MNAFEGFRGAPWAGQGLQFGAGLSDFVPLELHVLVDLQLRHRLLCLLHLCRTRVWGLGLRLEPKPWWCSLRGMALIMAPDDEAHDSGVGTGCAVV